MKAEVDAGVGASAHVTGEGDDRRLVVHLAPAPPDASSDFSLRCSFGTAPHSVQTSDF